MQNLAYGRKKPETPDSGTEWFDALSDNIELDDAHAHNGVDSPKLSSVSSTVVTKQTILAAAWNLIGNGTYRQLVTLPSAITAAVPTGAGLTFDDLVIQFRLSTGHLVFPTVEKVSATTYYVYLNDSTQALTAVYAT